MAVEVGGLVARFEADTSGLQRGAQEARGALQQVGQQAQRTADDLDATAARMAKSLGGTAAQWREILGHSGFEKVGQDAQQAAKAIDQVAAASQRAASANVAAARSAQAAGGGGFTPAAALASRAATGGTRSAGAAGAGAFSDTELLRFGAGIAGVGLGLSIVTGIATQIHNQIKQVVDDQLDWERSIKTLAGTYGQVGDNLARIAQVQATMPGLGRQEVVAQALISANDLRLRYGLSQDSIVQLTDVGRRAAGAFGITDQQQQLQLQQRIQEAVRSGQNIPEYGVFADQETMARRLGYSGAAAFGVFTPREQMDARSAAVLQQFNTAIDRANANQRAALNAVTNAQRAQDQARDTLQSTLESGGSRTVVVGGRSAVAVQGGREVARTVTLPSANIAGLPAIDAETAAMRATEQYVKAVTDSARAQADATKAINELKASADGAAAGLLSAFGSIENRFSIVHGDTLAQAQGSVAARAIGPNPLIARTPAEMAVAARETAEQQAYQSYVADRMRQAERDSGSPIRRFLEDQTRLGSGADRPAAQRALDEIQRRYLANTVSGQAQQAGTFAQRAQTEAQSQLSEIGVRQSERQLAVAEQLAGYRRDELAAEGQLMPLILAQANLQDRITVASRDNLTSRRQLIVAEQAAQGPRNTLSAIDYAQQRLELRAEVSRAAVRRSEGPTEDISALRADYRNLELGRPELELQNLDAQRNVDVVQQQRTGEDLARQGRLTDLEQESRVLQDQQIPLDQQLRATQAREQSVQRTLELLNLQDIAEQASAQRALNSATLLALQAGDADRAAQDMAAGMELGATRAERWSAALQKGEESLTNITNMAGQQREVDARIANGLGAGGIGPSPGQPPTPVFHINVSGGSIQQMKDQVHQEVEGALNQFFAGSSTAGAPAGVGVAGAGR